MTWEMMILAMLLCVGLAVVAYVMRMWPITFISSMGWVIVSFHIYQEYEDLLVVGLILMLAFSQIIMVRDKEGS